MIKIIVTTDEEKQDALNVVERMKLIAYISQPQTYKKNAFEDMKEEDIIVAKFPSMKNEPVSVTLAEKIFKAVQDHCEATFGYQGNEPGAFETAIEVRRQKGILIIDKVLKDNFNHNLEIKENVAPRENLLNPEPFPGTTVSPFKTPILAGWSVSRIEDDHYTYLIVTSPNGFKTKVSNRFFTLDDSVFAKAEEIYNSDTLPTKDSEITVSCADALQSKMT